MTIRDVMGKIRHITYVIIHKDGGTKCVYVNELTDYEYDYKFEWFEVSLFKGKLGIEFNL